MHTKMGRMFSIVTATALILLLSMCFVRVPVRAENTQETVKTDSSVQNPTPKKPLTFSRYPQPQELIAVMDMGDVAQFDRLLNTGIDPNRVISPSGKTLLMAAQSAPMVGLLLNHGADPSIKDNQGTTALHYAVMHPGALGIIPLLIEKGADINAPASGLSGETPFLYAKRLFLQRQDPVLGTKVLRLLAKLGADINAADDDGYTLLTHAVVNDKPDLVSLLVDLGANVRIRTRDGQTALDWAEELGFIDIVELLEKARSPN